MFSFNNFDRLILITQDKVTHLITYEGNTPSKILSGKTDTSFSLKELLQNKKGDFNDLVIFYIREPNIIGLNAIKDFVSKEKLLIKTKIIVLSTSLDMSSVELLRSLGIEDIITNAKDIDDIFQTLLINTIPD